MFDRRDLLKSAVGLGLAGALGCAGTPRRPSLIADENRKPGTTSWLLAPAAPRKELRDPVIEGYCSRTSVRAGDPLSVMVSADGSFHLDIYRLGYYGGQGGRHVRGFEGEARRQPDPSAGEDRLRECRWTPSLTFSIPDDWVSGVYLGKLRTSKAESYVIFIVRDDRPCDFLFQCSDTTWAAYNRWPLKDSLYDDGKLDWYTGPGVAVSFDRPYAKYRQIFDAPLSQGSGEFLLWEFPLAFWMESKGYDVSYISNLDTHVEAPLRAKAFLSVGHDEYWTRPMFDHALAAVHAGVNMAFFSGNSVDGLIDLRGRAFSRLGKFGVFEHELKKFEKPWKEHGPNPATLMGAR
ncbi:MAG TPA: N,N-dimethylformamidase beta subunit family domain-containing protein, partial [Planctomycetota bacterium]